MFPRHGKTYRAFYACAPCFLRCELEMKVFSHQEHPCGLSCVRSWAVDHEPWVKFCILPQCWYNFGTCVTFHQPSSLVLFCRGLNVKFLALWCFKVAAFPTVGTFVRLLSFACVWWGHLTQWSFCCSWEHLCGFPHPQLRDLARTPSF